MTTYKRTSGFRNWMNRRGYLPIIKGDVATFPDGSVYEVRKDGWRRIKLDKGDMLCPIK